MPLCDHLRVHMAFLIRAAFLAIRRGCGLHCVRAAFLALLVSRFSLGVSVSRTRLGRYRDLPALPTYPHSSAVHLIRALCLVAGFLVL